MPVKYCADTSALIHAWVRSYPFRNFGSVWDKFDSLIEAGRLSSSAEVLRELSRKNDELHAWAKQRQKMFIDIAGDELQEKVARIMREYPRLLDSRKQRSAADPFVIAAAQLWNPPLVIVTQEGATNNISKPNIPDVCEKEGLDCIPIVEVITREDWRF